MRPLTRLCCVLFVILIPLLSSPLTPTTSARTYAVTTDGDTHDANPFDSHCDDGMGHCTLRAAIEQVNGDGVAGVIGFFPTVGVINLNSPLPELRTNVTIMRQAPGSTVVRRAVPTPFRIFSVAAGVTATISNITVGNGVAPLPESGGPPLGGGGIYNAGSLTLLNVVVIDNSTSDNQPSLTPVAPAPGGGIYNDGVLTMNGCVVRSNDAGSAVAGTGLDGAGGGGIYNAGTLTMTNSFLFENGTGDGGGGNAAGSSAGCGGAGGAIYNAPSVARQVSATLTNCTLINNGTGEGGAVAPGPQAEMSTSGSGGAGGAIYNASNMTIVSGNVSNNTTGKGADAPQGVRTHAGKGGAGGGIYNNIPPGGGEMKLTNCLVTNNKTGRGGVGSGEIISAGDGGDGGGVANTSVESVLKMSQCTVARNQTGLAGDGGGRDGVGGGVYGAPRARSSIFALNFVRSPNNLSDLAGGPFISSGYNYIGFFGVDCCFTSTDRGGAGGSAADFLKLDPAFIPFPGSAAIDAGVARDVDDNPVTTDLRGAVRPFDFPDVAPPPDGDNSDIGAFERQSTDPTPTPTPTTVQFGASSAHVPEGCAQADITITRSGPKDLTTVVTYRVTDFTIPGAQHRGDFTYLKGQVTFAPGEDSKTIPVLLSEDAYHEDPEEFIAFIVGVEGGQVGSPNSIFLTIDDNDATDGTTNPIDDNATFVCQHYHDFLSRHADPEGQAFWTARLDECGGDAACLDRKRVDVSAAFFLSIEFQNTGYYVYRIGRVAFLGQPINTDFFTFFGNTQDVARGVVVGQPGFESLLDENKNRYAAGVVARSDFQTAHDGQTAAQYVDSLFANAGVTPTTAERDAAINAYESNGGGQTGQWHALRSVAESGSVYNKLYNPAFVLMQYFGYLRRNPNDPPDSNLDGYNFWLSKLDAATLPGEDARDETVAIRRIRRAEMVRAFLLSTEYRGRFGGDPSRGNP